MSSIFSGKILTSDENVVEIDRFIRVHKDGRCERLIGSQKLPAGIDQSTGVHSKDVVISPEHNLTARIFIPKTSSTDHKLPLLVFFHGGGFAVESTVSTTYHPTLNLLTAESNVIIVSVDYRLAPEFPLPAAYDDSWEAIKWVAAHSEKPGPETWLNEFADFRKVFLAGDSAGGNITHNMANRFGKSPINGLNLEGIVLIHPFFGGHDPIGSEVDENKQLKMFTDQFWKLANPISGLDDPWFNPGNDPNLAEMGCSKILICVAEKDSLKVRGLYYKELIEKSGWSGNVEIFESKQENHVFFLFNTSSENACILRKKISTFINQSDSNKE